MNAITAYFLTCHCQRYEKAHWKNCGFIFMHQNSPLSLSLSRHPNFTFDEREGRWYLWSALDHDAFQDTTSFSANEPQRVSCIPSDANTVVPGHPTHPRSIATSNLLITAREVTEPSRDGVIRDDRVQRGQAVRQRRTTRARGRKEHDIRSLEPFRLAIVSKRRH